MTPTPVIVTLTDVPETAATATTDVSEKAAKKVLTLAFIEDRNDKVLLGLKKRGFGEGLWNGFGGKVNPEEEIVDAAVRYVYFGIKIHSERLYQYRCFY